MARFTLHVWNGDRMKVPVMMSRAVKEDLDVTVGAKWQTD